MTKHNTNMAKEEPKREKAKRLIVNVGRILGGKKPKSAGMSEDELSVLLMEAGYDPLPKA